MEFQPEIDRSDTGTELFGSGKVTVLNVWRCSEKSGETKSRETVKNIKYFDLCPPPPRPFSYGCLFPGEKIHYSPFRKRGKLPSREAPKMF